MPSRKWALSRALPHCSGQTVRQEPPARYSNTHLDGEEDPFNWQIRVKNQVPQRIVSEFETGVSASAVSVRCTDPYAPTGKDTKSDSNSLIVSSITRVWVQNRRQIESHGSLFGTM
jgi:hypothetical protein